jgi:predicted nucleic acid-binding protein
MKTAVDTSVIHAILHDEPDGPVWLARLIKARSEGRLICCDVTYAEVAPSFESQDDLNKALANLGVEFDQIGKEAAFLAGQKFLAYRKRGGPRTQMVADFLIGAHAKIQADRLAAADTGYRRTYFSDLIVLTI